jgi:hypothetical protein
MVLGIKPRALGMLENSYTELHCQADSSEFKSLPSMLMK